MRLFPTSAISERAHGRRTTGASKSFRHFACAALFFALGTSVPCQTLSTQLFYDTALPVAYNDATLDGYPLVQSVGIGLALNVRERSIGLRVEREFFHYARTREAPPYVNAYREEVSYQQHRVTLFGAAEVGGSGNYRWELLGGFGVSWVVAQSTTGAREYPDGTTQDLDLRADATQAAYSIMLGLNCTRMFSNRIGVRAELLPIYRFNDEWVENPSGNGNDFAYPVVPDPVLLVKVGVGLIVRFGAEES